MSRSSGSSPTISDKTKRVLQDLGLTDYEIKVYLALLDAPGSQASEIGRSSEVPVSKIYEVLANLERKGWVESQQVRPAKYYPKSPSTALQAFRMRFERELKTNEEYLLHELMPRYEKKETQERREIWIIRGEYNILAKVRESIDRCKTELLAVVPPALNDAIDLIVPALQEIRKSEIKIRIMMSNEVSTASLKSISEIAELRLKENMFGGGVICDAREVVLLLGGGTADSTESSESALAIWSDHLGLASFAKNYFEFLWIEASPYAIATQKI
ncbi:MAG: TrmB family transcriptional regulator [Nitrososphaerales archaeon]